MAAASKLLSMSRGAGNKQTRRTVAVTLSGNYAAGGQVIDLTALTNPSGIDGGRQFSRIPEAVALLNCPVGFNGQWVPGTTLANGKFKIWDEVAAAELAAAGYPGGLTGADAITLEFLFKTLV